MSNRNAGLSTAIEPGAQSIPPCNEVSGPGAAPLGDRVHDHAHLRQVDPESRPDAAVPDPHARATDPLDRSGRRRKPDPSRNQASPEVHGSVHASPHADARTSPAEGRRAHVAQVQGGGATQCGLGVAEEECGERGGRGLLW